MLKYLAQTKYYTIMSDTQTPDPRIVFIALSDTIFTDNPDTRRSLQVYSFKLFNSIID